MRNLVIRAAFASASTHFRIVLMKLFACPACASRLYFENSRCLACSSSVAYAPERAGFVLVGAESRNCLNADECACNWVGDQRFGGYCRACALNRTIPDLSVPENRDRWARVERAKRRVVFALLEFGLPVWPKQRPADEEGLAFDFLADPKGAGPGGERILTGHDNGLITLNVAEADSPERERMRIAMGENYRTLLGHFRHELGHYYWDRLVRDHPERLEAFRALFGDEREDYAQALQRHYENAAPPDWEQRHISAYAASHAWEDWAETWAHYLHIADTLEMAEEFRIPLHTLDVAAASAVRETDPHSDIDGVVSRWLALTEIVNGINRCMGLRDLYPFVISPKVAEKLDYVRRLLKGA